MDCDPAVPAPYESDPARRAFPKSLRLRTKADFSRVYNRRLKGADGVLLMFVAENRSLNLPESPLTRLGLSVSRKVGNAVTRNRLKRWLREAFRLEQHLLPAEVDLVVIPLSVERAGLDNYRKSLKSLSARLLRQSRRPAALPPTAGKEHGQAPS